MKKIYYYNGLETNYEVTDDGKVFNRKTGRELKGTIKRNEYQTVQLSLPCGLKSIMVHRMIAEMFCEHPTGHDIVDHINQNKLDNRAVNLRWVTSQTNALNRVKPQRKKLAEVADFLDGTWKVYDEQYAVSSKGLIANRKTAKILTDVVTNGYQRVQIYGQLLRVHRLVYEIFNGSIPDGYVIDHIDGDRQNNRLENLQLVTQQQNVINSYSRERCGQIGVTQFSIEGEKLAHFCSLQEAANQLCVTYSALQAASQYGTKCRGYYWLRDDSITTEEQFVSAIPEQIKLVNNQIKAWISNDGITYSYTSKHCIPQFKDALGIYVYIANHAHYTKFYLINS